MKQPSLAWILVALPLVAAACSDDSSNPDGDGPDGDGDGTVKKTYVGAKGVTITQVAIYQGLKRTLVVGGAPGTNEVPLIAGRDAVVRIFYETDGDYDGGEVYGQFEIDGFDPVETPLVLGGASTEEDIGSTINLSIPGDRIGATLSWAASVVQEGAAVDDNAAAHWPSEGFDSVAVEGPAHKLRVILAPFQYNYDGSGRLPDLSPEGIERFRNRLKQLYPVADVEVTVRQPTPWNGYIGPDGSGWQEVGFTVYGMRSQDGASDDTYYYGIFSPAASFSSFCGGGCLLGVTLLNDNPPSTGSVDLRLALGVGFEGYAEDTAAHELGHSHGREHAPCGPGLDPGSIDGQYPHPSGQIGVWGLDPATLQLFPPTQHTDIMGYCNNQWISDYNFRALLTRGQNVNLPRWHAPARVPAILVGFDGAGKTTWGGATTAEVDLRGEHAPAHVIEPNGARRAVDAHVFRYDHLPGGLVIVPGADADAQRIEIDVDGRRLEAAR